MAEVLLVIDGVNMPTPSVYRRGSADIDSEDTRRNELGFLQRDRIRQGVQKVELEFRGLTNAQVQALEQAIEPAKITVTFITHAGERTAAMYAGDRQVELIRYHTGQAQARWNMSFNLIEY